MDNPIRPAHYADFQREFLKLAGTALACTWEVMGREVAGRRKHFGKPDLAFSVLGLVDHCGEMRLLCQEAQSARASVLHGCQPYLASSMQ